MAKRSETHDNGPRIVRANLKREIVKTDNFVSIYANDTQVQLSAWDIRLIFGVIDAAPTLEDDSAIVRQLGEVRMSLPHAKRVAQILVQQIGHYENMTKSEIPLPE